jgi:serine/threonine protein kinase
LIGETVAKYRILAELGRGSMGIVYKAQDTFLGRFAALKLLAEEYLEDGQALGRFEREGRAASALVHPNICTVFDTGSWRHRPYLAMEFLQGQTLSERIREGALPTGEALRIALSILSALEAAHQAGIVHRDIKPANLFLTARGVPKILDFGLAKWKRRRETAVDSREDAPTIATFVTMPGTVLGTLAYMAPEQMAGEAVDGRADLYSMGVVLHEMCTGAVPLRGSANSALPAPIGGVVAKLIEIDPNARYRDAAEVSDALRRIMV